MLDASISATVRDKDGWTPLHTAATNADAINILALLLKYITSVGDLNIGSKSGLTPLHVAGMRIEHNVYCLRFLLCFLHSCIQQLEGVCYVATCWRQCILCDK